MQKLFMKSFDNRNFESRNQRVGKLLTIGENTSVLVITEGLSRGEVAAFFANHHDSLFSNAKKKKPLATPPI